MATTQIPSLIDSHAHLSSPLFATSIEAALQRAANSGVQAIINICTNPQELAHGLALKRQYPWISCAGATTPHDAEKEGALYFDEFAAAARQGQLVAVGEIGLDYHYFPQTADIQKDLLKKYLKLAIECNLPVIIHCRNAFDDFFEIIDQHYIINGHPGPGVLHCFTGTIDEAQQVIKRGWYLSLSGIVTFKKSYELWEVAKQIPLSQLLIETDSPYLAPQKRRGETNEPAFLIEIAQFVASQRGISLEQLSSAIFHNACQLFKLKN